jgi:hypothetical protein
VILVRIMPPVPSQRGGGRGTGGTGRAATSTAMPCVASRELPARGDAPFLCGGMAGRACFFRPIFCHFLP